MDKVQKQLIDTYYRKRNIGIHYYRVLEGYEIVYALLHDIKIDTNLIRTNKLAIIVAKYPEIITKLKTDIFDTSHITDMLAKEQGLELYKYFDLDRLSTRQIVDLLYNRQEYADILDLSKLSSDNIRLLLRYRPNLITKLDLTKLDSSEIEDIVFHQPSLKPYFKGMNWVDYKK